MKQRRIIYACAIMTLAFIQLVPCILVLSGSIMGAGIGCIYIILLAYFWRSTIIGKWFFRELWRSTLRMEDLLFPLSEEKK